MSTQRYTRDELRKRAEEILEFATSQPILDALKAVLDTPSEQQLDEAAKRFAPEKLEALGLTSPPKTRLSSRIFDEVSGTARVLGSPADATLNLSLPRTSLNKIDIDELVDRNKLIERALENGWSVCLCAGAGGCVGVGGGS